MGCFGSLLFNELNLFVHCISCGCTCCCINGSSLQPINSTATLLYPSGICSNLSKSACFHRYAIDGEKNFVISNESAGRASSCKTGQGIGWHFIRSVNKVATAASEVKFLGGMPAFDGCLSLAVVSGLSPSGLPRGPPGPPGPAGMIMASLI